MKFGKHLNRTQLSAWTEFYVDYAKLKSLTMQAAEARDSHEKVKALSAFDTLFWDEVSKVNAHFEEVISHLEDRTQSLEDHYIEEFREPTRSRSLSWAKEETANGGGTSVGNGAHSNGHGRAEDLLAKRNKNRREGVMRHLESMLLDVLINLEQLKDFSSMNYTAFYKILKKHDKKAGGEKRMRWLGEIEHQPFYNKERLEAMCSKVEHLNDEFGGHVAEEYQEHAMGAKMDESHMNYAKLCFWLGFITMGLFNTAILVCMPATNEEFTMLRFMSIIPIFRFFFLLNLLVWLMGWCTFVMEKYKVNYLFLLNIDPSCPLESTTLFKLASSMSGAFLLIFWAYLADFKFGLFSTTFVEVSVAIYPVILLATMFAMFYYMIASIQTSNSESRYGWDLLLCIGSVFSAPFVPVTFASNLVGDILTSFTRPLTDLIYSSCYYSRIAYEPSRLLEGHVHHVVRLCHEINRRYICSVILSLPYVFRLLQCLRRFYDDRTARQHLANAGKYSCSILVTAITLLAPNSAIWVACYTVATIYACVWDFKMDWGLSLSWQEHTLTRSRLMYPPAIYRAFAALNVIGRSTWAFSTLVPSATVYLDVRMEIVNFVMSAFEIYRRAQWAILRIEHEHLTNSSKYRTLCWVPPLLAAERKEPLPRTHPPIEEVAEDISDPEGHLPTAVNMDNAFRMLSRPLLEGDHNLRRHASPRRGLSWDHMASKDKRHSGRKRHESGSLSPIKVSPGGEHVVRGRPTRLGHDMPHKERDVLEGLHAKGNAVTV